MFIYVNKNIRKQNEKVLTTTCMRIIINANRTKGDEYMDRVLSEEQLARREKSLERFTELNDIDKGYILGIISAKLLEQDNKKSA